MVFSQFIWLATPVLWALLLFLYFTRDVYRQNQFMIFEAAISLLSTLLLFFTWWLMLPILVLFPLALYFAFRCYKKAVACFQGFPILARVFGLIPMAIALAVWPAISSYFAGSFRV